MDIHQRFDQDRHPWTFVELEAATGLDADTLRHQLRWAERHDILHKTELYQLIS